MDLRLNRIIEGMGLDLVEKIFMNSVTWSDINIKHERLYELIGIVITIMLCWGICEAFKILNTHESRDPCKINNNITMNVEELYHLIILLSIIISRHKSLFLKLMY